jgi:hypothetical protein
VCKVTIDGDEAHIEVDLTLNLRAIAEFDKFQRIESLNEQLGVHFTPVFEKIRKAKEEIEQTL